MTLMSLCQGRDGPLQILYIFIQMIHYYTVRLILLTFLQRNCNSPFNCKMQITHIVGNTTIHSNHSQRFGVYYMKLHFSTGFRIEKVTED